MTTITISTDTTIAAQQLAAERDKIWLNDHLCPEAKEWHIRRLDKDFAAAQYSQTLSPPARIAWILVSLPAIFVRNLYDMPNILQYGLSGGHGALEDSPDRHQQSLHGATTEDEDSTALTEAGEHEG